MVPNKPVQLLLLLTPRPSNRLLVRLGYLFSCLCVLFTVDMAQYYQDPVSVDTMLDIVARVKSLNSIGMY